MKPNMIEIVTKDGLKVYVNFNFVICVEVHDTELKILMTNGGEFIVDSEAYKQKLMLFITTLNG